MATSGISPVSPFVPALPPARVTSTVPIGDVSQYSNALGLPDAPVAVPVLARPDATRRPPGMQARPEYALVMLMAQRPGQLRKLFETLGGPGASLDLQAATADLDAHLLGGGTLAQFGASRGLDPTSLYLLAVQSRIAQRSGKKASHRVEREMDDLLAEHETEIGATLNTSQAMRTLAGSASDRMWMRSLYVAAVMVRSPINETFESLLQRFGTEGFERGAATLLRALSDDIAAHRSSVAPDRLQGLLLSSLVAMRNVLGLIHSSQGYLRGQGLMHVAAVPAKSGESRKRGDDNHGGDGERRQSGRDAHDKRGDQKDADAPPLAPVSAEAAALADQHRKVEVMTVQLVRLLLQLTMNSNAAKAVPMFLNQDVGKGMKSEELVRVRSQFLQLIGNLPSSLWKEATHKDQLVETLRRQFEAELIHRSLPASAPAGGPAKS